MKTPKFRPDYRIKPKTTKSQAKTPVKPENVSRTTVKTESAVASSDGLGRITDEEMYRAVAGKAAMAEHDANAAQRCGLHGEQLESVKRHAATLQAAANKLRPNKSPSMTIEINARPLRLKPQSL